MKKSTLFLPGAAPGSLAVFGAGVAVSVTIARRGIGKFLDGTGHTPD